MDRVVGQIYCTNDYTKFKKLSYNRAVLEHRKTLLVESFKNGEIMNPIVVNQNMEIVDGQGRYEAKKELGLPIYYIVDPEAGIDDCRRMNAYNKAWSATDFVESISESGNENYTRLMEAKEKTGLSYGLILRLANKGCGSGKSDEAKVKRGNAFLAAEKLIFTEKDKNKSINVYNMAEEIKIALAYSRKPNAAFFTAVSIMVANENYNHKRFINNCEKCRHRYSQMSRLEDELKEFSDIYNYNTSKNKIFFEDYMRNKGHNAQTYDMDNLHRRDRNVSTLGE